LRRRGVHAGLAAGSREDIVGIRAGGGGGGGAVTADCTGPGGEFTSEVFWRRPDRTLLRQSDAAGVRELLAHGERAWARDSGDDARAAPLPAGTASMVHGHAFHPTLFELDRRFREHRAAGTGPGGCLRVEMLDGGNRPAAVCLDPRSKLPKWFSFEPEGPGGTIELHLSDWQRYADLLYFTAFTLRQGEEEYRWFYRSIRPNVVDSRLQSPLEAESAAGTLAPGGRISLSLKNADLADVLRSFAQMAGFNLVLDPSVAGAVTVELQDVPWEQALEVILQTHGLGAEIDGTAWRIHPR
jgi:hypothetical protein